MSSCIEIYCLHLLNSPNYLPCLQNYCPDAVVSVLPKRGVSGDDDTASLNPSEGEGQFVTCPERHGTRYCVGFVCHEVFSGVILLDVATSRCALLHCASSETDYQRCVVDTCCWRPVSSVSCLGTVTSVLGYFDLWHISPGPDLACGRPGTYFVWRVNIKHKDANISKCLVYGSVLAGTLGPKRGPLGPLSLAQVSPI